MTTEIRNYSWEYKGNNDIVIYEQYKEDENTYNCISHIVEQLKKENKNFIFHLKKKKKEYKTKENNKLIAEFMGYEIIYRPYSNGFIEISDTELCDVDDLQYHTSWDWLMPVANEIIKSRDEQNADWDLTDLKYALCTTNIELVYKEVVEFIKEYNN